MTMKNLLQIVIGIYKKGGDILDDVIISKTKRSLINRYFTKEVYLELLKITMMGDISNNEKNAFVKTLLTEYNIPFSGLGPGTNRMAVLIDGYADRKSVG